MVSSPKSLRRSVSDDQDVKNLVERLVKFESDYFRFVDEPIPSTNNPTEQTIRKGAIGRKISQAPKAIGGELARTLLERRNDLRTTPSKSSRLYYPNVRKLSARRERILIRLVDS